MTYIHVEFWMNISNISYRFSVFTSFKKTQHCELYSLLNWTSLHIRRETHWYIFIYKVLRGLLPEYLQKLLKPHSHIQLDRQIIFPWLFLERKLLMVIPLLNLLPQMIGICYKSY